MKIEDYWLDCSSYYVSFEADGGRVIEKNLILPIGLTEEEICRIVYSNFAKVSCIKRVEFFGDGLILYNRIRK